METQKPVQVTTDRQLFSELVRETSSTNKQDEVTNLLYRQPELYEKVYPVLDDELAKMCQQMFGRYLQHYPSSILDIGCGTGRELNALARNFSECIGIDYLPEMVRHAQSKYPTLTFQESDMRTFRLERNFEAILCLGWAITYALTNEDIGKTLQTFAAHAQKGSLLVLELLNGARYLSESGFQECQEFEINTDEVTGKAIATYTFQRRQQLIVRKRVWKFPGQDPVVDYCRYRLFFPAELEHLLTETGFKVVGMFDNRALEESDLSGRVLNVAAIFDA
ncbi:class I SAM-dependent methyltransferase [Microcoleus sp. F8-D3]